MKKIKQLGCSFLAIAFLLAACKKENKELIPVDKDVFVSVSGAGSLNNTLQVTLSNEQISAGAKIKIGADLTKAAATDIRAEISVDTSLFAAYKTKAGINLRLLPAAAYTLKTPNGGVTVKAGTDFSIDSAILSITNVSVLKSAKYILPIKISGISGSNGAQLSNPANVVYYEINFSDIIQTTISLTGAGAARSVFNVANTDVEAKNIFAVLNQPLNSAVKANIAIDTALVKTFNSTYNTTYKVLPTASYSFTSAELSVAVGSTQSNSAVKFQLTDPSLLNPEFTYLLPVKIASFSGNYDLDKGNDVVYIQVGVLNNVEAGATEIPGTLIDRTAQGWIASADKNSDTAFGVLDGDASTDWLNDAGLPSYIQIDMGTDQTINGISYIPSYLFAEFGYDLSPTDIEVFTSVDGVKFEKQGQFIPTPRAEGSTVTAPDTKFIKFTTPVKARYFRLNILHSAFFDIYVGLAEVNAYK